VLRVGGGDRRRRQGSELSFAARPKQTNKNSTVALDKKTKQTFLVGAAWLLPALRWLPSASPLPSASASDPASSSDPSSLPLSSMLPLPLSSSSSLSLSPSSLPSLMSSSSSEASAAAALAGRAAARCFFCVFLGGVGVAGVGARAPKKSRFARRGPSAAVLQRQELHKSASDFFRPCAVKPGALGRPLRHCVHKLQSGGPWL
jgi:hypothetical protein